MKIAIDAMGGDYAPLEIVKGTVDAAKTFNSDEMLLVGDQHKIKKCVSREFPENIKIIHTDQFVEMDENPTSAIKKKPDSSMNIVARMVREGTASAMVSAGNTGALLQSSLLTIGRIKGIRRPAIAAFLPTRYGLSMLVDAGANADCKEEYLIQFALMGSMFMHRIKGLENPKVGLVNIGEEATKGNLFYRQVYEMLKNENRINFVGNVEPKDFFAGKVDVAVADGFVGNLVLKSSEAAAEFMLSVLREEIKSSFIAKVSALTLKPIFKNLKKRLDHSEYGGALLMGLNGICIKSHGRADARTIYNAIKVAREMHQHKIIDLISEITKETDTQSPEPQQKQESRET